MSDNTPLFTNTDTQEATYAPQELPTGSAGRHASDAEGGDQETSAGGGGGGGDATEVAPGPGAGLLGGASGIGLGTGAGGMTGSSAVPPLGAAALGTNPPDGDEDPTS